MTWYERRPKTVEAILWNGMDGVYEIIEEMVYPTPIDRQGYDDLALHYFTGSVIANIGDWVIKDDEGVVSAVKPEVFQRIYFQVEEPPRPEPFDQDVDVDVEF